MKVLNKVLLLGSASMMMLFSSCTQDADNAGDVDDNFLNFEIPTIKPTELYAVGAYYINPGSSGQNSDRYARLEEASDKAAGQLGPYVRLQLGNYAISPNSNDLTDEMVDNVQQHVDWAIENGIDFFILPSLKPSTTKVYPEAFQGSDQFYNMMIGKNFVNGGTEDEPEEGKTYGKKVDLKSLKFIAQADVNSPLANGECKIMGENGVLTNKSTTKLDYKHPLEDNDSYVTYLGNKLYTRTDMYIEFFCSLDTYFKDEHYYRYNGRPVVLLQGMNNVYLRDCQAFFQKIREAVKERTGEDIYLVARQDPWSPAARFQYFYKGVDAITFGNMYLQGEWTRSLCYPQMIYRNWEYNRQYWEKKWNGTDFIPTGPVAFNRYVDNGEGGWPIVEMNPKTFRTICNVMKAQSGKCRIMFIDSFNDIQYDSFLEPTDPEYGNGQGDAFLKVCKEEFKP